MSEPVVVTPATTTPATGVDAYLPGPVSVLIEWIILLISTISTFFARKG